MCDQLNKPTIDAVKNLANRKQWQCVTSGVTGRMFKVNCNIMLLLLNIIIVNVAYISVT